MTLNKAYRDTLGKPELRSAMIGGLHMDLDQARKAGNSRWEKAIERELVSLGEGDIIYGQDDGESIGVHD